MHDSTLRSQLTLLIGICALLTTPVCLSQNWQLQSPISSPPPHYFAGMGSDLARQKVVLFGGEDGSGDFFDQTWLWDGQKWSNASPATHPSYRRLTAPLVFDTVQNQLVMFGGSTFSGSFYNETWTWDGATWTNKTPVSPADSPSPRSEYSLAYDQAHDKVVLFGGLFFNGSAFVGLKETWLWDGQKWAEVFPANDPGEHYSHAMTYDTARSETVLFGGYRGGVPLNETWIWDGTNWTQRFPVHSPPASATFDVRNVMAYDPGSHLVILLRSNGDTWVWDGTDWSQLSTTLQPPRTWPGMAYNSVTGGVLAFGGFSNAGVVLNDTWLLRTAELAAGTIDVETNLAAATFTISDGQGDVFSGSGVSFQASGVKPGVYTIVYGPVPGYRPPLSQSLSLAPDGTIAFKGTYSPIPILSILPARVQFQPVPIGKSLSMQITLTDTGAAPLVVQSVVSGDPVFRVTALHLPLNIAPGHSASFELSFVPISVAPYGSAIAIASDDPGSPAVIPVSGEGMLIRIPPFDSAISCQREETFNAARVRSVHHANNGAFQLGVEANATGNALGADGLGIAYKPEFTGQAVIRAVVELESGSFDLLELVSVPEIDRTGESATISSAAFVKVNESTEMTNVFRSAELLPESCNSLVPFCQDLMNYSSPLVLPVETTIPVVKGQFNFICGGLAVKTITTGAVPLASISEAKYKARLLRIQITPAIGQ